MSKSPSGLSPRSIVFLVVTSLLIIVGLTYGSQLYVDRGNTVRSAKLAEKKTEYEISKLEAEISKIRSDTAGSLFWLKLVALFVTVGGAIGGYLVGQSRTTIARLNFEDRKNVDEVYQSIIQELAGEAPILRASAAVKLGSILRSFPSEWNVSDTRKEQICQLTKHVLAAALSIEDEPKVLKALSINLVLQKLKNGLANAQELDLSGAKAADAYWAKCDFSYSDFFVADLSNASFRKSVLSGAQFRQANLREAVLDDSLCEGTNFKLADLRGASFNGATIRSVNFDMAKVHGVSLESTIIEKLKNCIVDTSPNGDESQLKEFDVWIKEVQSNKDDNSELPT